MEARSSMQPKEKTEIWTIEIWRPVIAVAVDCNLSLALLVGCFIISSNSQILGIFHLYVMIHEQNFGGHLIDVTVKFRDFVCVNREWNRSRLRACVRPDWGLKSNFMCFTRTRYTVCTKILVEIPEKKPTKLSSGAPAFTFTILELEIFFLPFNWSWNYLFILEIENMASFLMILTF